MNLNFDDISKKFKQFSKDRVEDVQKLNELRVLNGQISGARKKINGLYAEIGKRIFEQYREVPLEGFETEIQSILEQMTLIQELKEKKRALKQTVVCPCCGTEVPAGENFCSNCGCRMPEEKEDDDDIAADGSDVKEDEAYEEIIDETAEGTVNETSQQNEAAEEVPVQNEGSEEVPSGAVPEEEPDQEEVPEASADKPLQEES